jgi:hypothetical protein
MLYYNHSKGRERKEEIMKTISITKTCGPHINETRIGYYDTEADVNLFLIVDNRQGELELQKWERKLGIEREKSVNEYNTNITYYSLYGFIED